MSQLAQASDHLEHLGMDATRLPWGVLHHGSRTGSSWINAPGKEVGMAGADDADLILAAVNALPALVNLLRVIDKTSDPESPEYMAAFSLAHHILSGE